MDAAVLCETIMLITFGCSWPFNITKSIKSRTTLGKSVAFEIIIVIGYLFGVAAKLIIYNRYFTGSDRHRAVCQKLQNR